MFWYLGGPIFFPNRKKGDILIVESDQKVKKLKGDTRPVHTQQERARVLSALRTVDFVIILPFMDSDESYGQLIQEIQPDIIAVTEGYKNTHQERIAQMTGAKLKYVTKKIGDHSTSKILNH